VKSMIHRKQRRTKFSVFFNLFMKNKKMKKDYE
jgi:hypothetical protein